MSISLTKVRQAARLTYERTMCELTAWAVVDFNFRRLALAYINTAENTINQSINQSINGCVLFQIQIYPDQSRFVRRDRSSLVKKNARIFLAVVVSDRFFSDASERSGFDKERGAFRSD